MGQFTVRYRVIELGDRKDRSMAGRDDDDLDAAGSPISFPWQGYIDYPVAAAAVVNDHDEGFLLRFLWWSIVGNATVENATLSQDPSHQPVVYVGNTSIITNANNLHIATTTVPGDITATAWYIEDDGSVSGLLIDAFNGDIGELSNAPFVTVKRDDAAHHRTDTANNLGTVDTTDITLLEAYSKLSHVVPFVTWAIAEADGVKIVHGMPAPHAGEWLEAQAKSRGIAIALYETPPQTTVPNVIGETPGAAISILTGVHLHAVETVKTVTLKDDPYVPPVYDVPPPNYEGGEDKDPPSDFFPAAAFVTEQSPPAETIVAIGSSVNITVTLTKHEEKPFADGTAT